MMSVAAMADIDDQVYIHETIDIIDVNYAAQFRRQQVPAGMQKLSLYGQTLAASNNYCSLNLPSLLVEQ